LGIKVSEGNADVNIQNWLTLAIAALGIAGTLAGSTLQHYWNIQAKQGQEFEERRRTAYVEFLRALDIARIAETKDAEANSFLDDADKEQKDTKRARELRKQAQSRRDEARSLIEEFEKKGGAAMRLIAVYGDKEVVEAFANYARALDKYTKGQQGHKPCPPIWGDDVAIYHAIRRSSMGPSQDVKSIDLAISALFCDPTKPYVAQQPLAGDAPQAARP
jgi:hypothetical protein